MEKSRELRPGSGSVVIVVGLLLFAFAILSEMGIIALFHGEGRDGMIAITILSIVVVGSAVVLGIVCIRGHFVEKRQVDQAVERYGEEKILSEIEHAVIWIYHEPLTHREIYFTKSFVVAPKHAIFAYEEIARVYKDRNMAGKVHSTLVGFRLLNGDKHLLCDYASDSDVQNIMEICHGQNPRIALGIGDAKKITSVSNGAGGSVEGGATIPWELTPEGSKYETGRRLAFIGLIIAVMEGISMLGLPLVMDYDISNPFSILGPMLVLGSILIGGVVMAIIGRKMMKKWGK